MSPAAAHIPVDPLTSEVVEAAVAARRSEDIAARLVEIAGKRSDLAEVARPLLELDADLAAAERDLKVELYHLSPIGTRIGVGEQVVTISPPRRRPPRNIDREACKAHGRDLARLGLGEWVEEYKVPTAGALRKAAREVIAAGLPFEDLLPDPGPGVPLVEVVAAADLGAGEAADRE